MRKRDRTYLMRKYEPRDEEALYDVCLRTGAAGQDASRIYENPRALGHLYVGPYITLEPDLAFVLEDHGGVCGYVLGALDTHMFFRALERDWFPELRKHYPPPKGEFQDWNADEKVYHSYHHFDYAYPPALQTYPSHLHIDLLPRAQSRGWGTMMVTTLLDELRRRGSPGVHLGMAPSNTRAESFYRKLGFRELLRLRSGEESTLYLGKRLDQEREHDNG